MAILSKLANAVFGSPEKRQQKRAFNQALQAIRVSQHREQCSTNVSDPMQSAKLDPDQNQSLLIEAIKTDNLNSFKVVLAYADMNVSQRLVFNASEGLSVQAINTPMLDYAVSVGSRNIALFLARHPETDLRARGMKKSSYAVACGPMGCSYVHETKEELSTAAQLAPGMGMTEVADIINTRLKQQQPAGPAPSNG